MNTILFYVVMGGDTPLAFEKHDEAKAWAKQIVGYVTEEYLTREKYIEYTWENISEEKWNSMANFYKNKKDQCL